MGFEPKEKFKLNLENYFGGGFLKFNFKSNDRFITRIEDKYYSLSTYGQYQLIDLH